MISRQDIQRLLHVADAMGPVLSVFLDMSVNSENKRTYMVFLNQERSRHGELDSDRDAHHREAIGAALERVERWIADSFEEANKGVAVYTVIGGDWLEGLQFPVSVRNRVEISDRPVIGPLAQVVESHPRHGVILVDREHLRLIGVVLGEPVIEHEVRTEPYPAPHALKRGGYSAKDYQKRKAEEVRHFFKEFALEATEFDRRYRPDDLVLLGTADNVRRFTEFLPQQLRAKVVHTAHAPIAAGAAEVLERLAPFFREQLRRGEEEVVGLLHERVRQAHLAVAGFRRTLEELQEAQVELLVLPRDGRHLGARCLRCGFHVAGTASACPYCRGTLRDGVDLVEAMIGLAEEQNVTVRFVEPPALVDLDGVGALLRF
ncbi:MAG TPA: hypothetical protein VF188_09855 [Longimicrobiales bacterium]